MKFTNIFITILFIILISPISTANYLNNGGFETGDFTGWTILEYGSQNIYPDFNFSVWGNYSYHAYGGNCEIKQIVNMTGHNKIAFDIYCTSVGTETLQFQIRGITDNLPIYLNVNPTTERDKIVHCEYDISGLSGNKQIRVVSYHMYSHVYWDNFTLDDNLIWNVTPPISESFIQFEGTPYKEYDYANVNFSVEKIMDDYPDKRIFLEIATPKITEPYYNYAAYELGDSSGYLDYTYYSGHRGLEITGKSPVTDTFHNCSAFIRAYDQDMTNHTTLLEIEEPVLSDNHTLLNYTGYHYPTNKSYITGQYIGIDVDIIEHIETDFLYWPDEHFLLHVYAYSNSNQGNREYEYHIDPKYWDAEYYHTHHFSCLPYDSIDANFNATIYSFITVYRNGNTTQLTPTINTTMWSSDYIPEGETGYEPPDIPEEPEEPDTGENETLPINPDEPDIPIVTNQSINTSWVYYYYEGVNNSLDTLCSPVYNFTGYTLTPIYLLNDSITDYNYLMNESFIESTEKINLLSGSFNIIYSSFHPKIIGVITYYLIWLVLLIVLKKR